MRLPPSEGSAYAAGGWLPTALFLVTSASRIDREEQPAQRPRPLMARAAVDAPRQLEQRQALSCDERADPSRCGPVVFVALNRLPRVTRPRPAIRQSTVRSRAGPGMQFREDARARAAPGVRRMCRSTADRCRRASRLRPLHHHPATVRGVRGMVRLPCRAGACRHMRRLRRRRHHRPAMRAIGVAPSARVLRRRTVRLLLHRRHRRVRGMETAERRPVGSPAAMPFRAARGADARVAPDPGGSDFITDR
jgi:hypothetical protein